MGRPQGDDATGFAYRFLEASGRYVLDDDGNYPERIREVF